ncbi:GTPase Era [Helcococcus ovis]|uniref:GTPase Era n=1 Tax=Helcococcus ovis TaxID=72026 RepID=A0A4R9C2A0_9FIRM|nr:GTPase Era [Helcococcus ovis]TFF64798.1 GTPase Era [Helcococcus ovis]TFF65913.1 GTPase Era [Helcococcus ovis]TFF67194.1 GTPase Era [Helcococcus ovis]WNZ01023.1 GTPase Era [Helcococcus ovis]
MFKSGFITVIGRPNVGKSTLLNGLIGEKISIISDKPQTTRNKIQMVLTNEYMQVVFLDTPGIQMPKNKLGDYMLSVSKSTLNEVDIVTFMVDMSDDIGKLDQYIIDILDGVNTKVILLVNKIDTAENQEQVEKIVLKYKSMNKFEKVIPISALEQTNYQEYLDTVYSLLEEGPQYYPSDMITDQPERNIIAEIIREKVLKNMYDEIPHGIAVEVLKISENEETGKMQIEVNLYVEQNSHKGMVIGKGGTMLKKIGTQSRRDIENLLDTKVNLKIWVKVAKDWRKKDSRVKDFGYR